MTPSRRARSARLVRAPRDCVVGRWRRPEDSVEGLRYQPPRSGSVGCPDGETGSERRCGQALSHHVGELLICWNMNDAQLTEGDSFPQEVDVQLDMLGTPVMYRVLAHVDGGYVVAVGDRGAWNVDVELAEQLA